MFNRTLDGDAVIAMPPRPDAACNRREHVGEALRQVGLNPWHERIRRAQADIGPATSIVRRLSAILNIYPPNRSIAAINSSRNAASHRSGVPKSSGFPNMTTRAIPSGICHPINYPDEALSCAHRKGNREKLKGKIYKGQPRQIEAEASR
jgi:hypothetical protein